MKLGFWNGLSTFIKMGGGLAEGTAISFLLRDEFWDVRAAGSVDATPATPGPGTRAVTDTNSKISVGSGVLDFATGEAVGDGIWWDQQTRAAGLVGIAKLTHTSGIIDLNFDVDTTSPSFEGFLISANDLYSKFAGVNIKTGTVSYGTAYMYATVLRTNGIYTFIKGGAYTTWTLLLSSTTGTDNLYPSITTRSGTSVFTADFLRVPIETWLPTPLAYDTFTRANGAIGNSEIIGPDGQSVVQRGWSAKLGTWNISSNTALCSVLSGGEGIVTVPSGNSNVFVGANLTRSAGNLGLVIRWLDANNYIYTLHNGTNVQLIKVVAGTPTTLIDTAVTYSAGAKMRAHMMGTACRIYYNNALVGSQQTISDASLQDGANHGLYTTNTGNTFDNFEAFPANTTYDAFLDKVTA